ncbi:hypothetical protein HK405_010423, partial [Cladochytrium tenue]
MTTQATGGGLDDATAPGGSGGGSGSAGFLASLRLASNASSAGGGGGSGSLDGSPEQLSGSLATSAPGPTTPLLRSYARLRSYTRNSFPQAGAGGDPSGDPLSPTPAGSGGGPRGGGRRGTLPRPLSLILSPTQARVLMHSDSIGGPLEAPASAAPGLGRRPVSYVTRRSRQYDDIQDDGLFQEGNGLRVWYRDYTTIDWIHDYVKERVRIRRLRSVGGWRGRVLMGLDSVQAWVLILIIGVVCGVIASIIAVTELWLTDFKTGFCYTSILRRLEQCCPPVESGDSSSRTCSDWVPWESVLPIRSQFGLSPSELVFVTGSAALALFAVLVTNLSATESRAAFSGAPQKSLMYQAAGSGVPQVKTILGGFVIRGFLGLRTLVVKTGGLILAVASGLSIGQQGPLVHIACCVGNVSSRLFEKYATNEAKRREMLSAASAAGVSVAFGAPIGGVLFALEEVSYYFPSKTMWRSFFCALAAAVTLKLINPFGTGKLVMFQ